MSHGCHLVSQVMLWAQPWVMNHVYQLLGPGLGGRGKLAYTVKLRDWTMVLAQVCLTDAPLNHLSVQSHAPRATLSCFCR